MEESCLCLVLKKKTLIKYINLIGIFLCVKNQQLRDMKAGLDGFLDMRYLIAMMGLFAFYCGFIYNDFLSMPWNLFGSCFERVEDSHNTVQKEDCVYPLGKNNKINFMIEKDLIHFGLLHQMS